MRPIVVNVLATCLLGTAPGLYSAAYALNFYVSTENVHGREQQSFSSLSEVQQAVRDVISKGMNEDIIVLFADGTYYLPDGTLNFSSADSGQNGHTVYWKASGSAATISAGMKVSGWIKNATTGIWHASIPKGTQSRNLFVNGWAAQYARTALNRTYFKATNTSYAWDNSEYDWLMTTPGISSAEIRSIQSFTDHYAPIKAIGDRELIMAQYTWQNQICCWDDIADPYADFGLYVQNALVLLDEGGEFYVDSEADLVYYMPLDGEDMTTAETYLGLLEAVISISGTYEDPAHDISFENLNFVSGKLSRYLPSSVADFCHGHIQHGFELAATAMLTSKLEDTSGLMSATQPLKLQEAIGTRTRAEFKSVQPTISGSLVAHTLKWVLVGLGLVRILMPVSVALALVPKTLLSAKVTSLKSWATALLRVASKFQRTIRTTQR